jgi:hypothetical protein
MAHRIFLLEIRSIFWVVRRRVRILPPSGECFAVHFSIMLRNKVSVARDSGSCVVKVIVAIGASEHLDGIREFHLRNDIAEYYLWCRTNDGDVLHLTFPEPAYAEFFIAEFGGELVSSPPNRCEERKNDFLGAAVLHSFVSTQS